MDRLNDLGRTLGTAFAGFTGTELLQVDPSNIGNTAASVADILVKIAIGVATLLGIFRKKKK